MVHAVPAVTSPLPPQDPAGIFELIEVIGNGTYGQVHKVTIDTVGLATCTCSDTVTGLATCSMGCSCLLLLWISYMQHGVFLPVVAVD